MKLAPEAPSSQPAVTSLMIELPFGLIGLAHLKHFELTPVQGVFPLMRLASIGQEQIQFLVLEPQEALKNYEIELRDEDTDILGISAPDDCLVINIVTIHSESPQYVTLNLIGPIVINRHTLVGKQVILENSERYSTNYALVDDRPSASRGS